MAALYTDFEVVAYVTQIHEFAAQIDRSTVEIEDVEKNIVRCPDNAIAKKMISLIETVRDEGDSVGGAIECVARGIPPGLGEPVFDKLEADLAKAILSIPAAKAFEIGSGFGATRMRGSQHNDAFKTRAGKIRTTTNNSGGVQGGMSNGEDIYFRVAFKPPATIALYKRPSPFQRMSMPSLPPADAMIRVFFHEPCRSSKPWPRLCFAIMR